MFSQAYFSVMNFSTNVVVLLKCVVPAQNVISSGLGKSFLAFRKFIVIVILLLSLYISVLGQHLLCCIPQFLTYRSAKYKMFLALISLLDICVCSGYSSCD